MDHCNARPFEHDRLTPRPTGYPMSHVFQRHTRAALPTAQKGEGFIIDTAGKPIWTRPAVPRCLATAIRKSSRRSASRSRPPFAHTGFSRMADGAAGGETGQQGAWGFGARLFRLRRLRGGGSGIEARRQYFLEIGEPDRRHISRDGRAAAIPSARWRRAAISGGGAVRAAADGGASHCPATPIGIASDETEVYGLRREWA